MHFYINARVSFIPYDCVSWGFSSTNEFLFFVISFLGTVIYCSIVWEIFIWLTVWFVFKSTILYNTIAVSLPGMSESSSLGLASLLSSSVLLCVSYPNSLDGSKFHPRWYRSLLYNFSPQRAESGLIKEITKESNCTLLMKQYFNNLWGHLFDCSAEFLQKWGQMTHDIGKHGVIIWLPLGHSIIFSLLIPN